MEGAPKQEDIREKLIQEIDDLRLELNELMDKMSEMPSLTNYCFGAKHESY